MTKIRLKDVTRNGMPESEFKHGSIKGNDFSFTSKDGEKYRGIMMTNNKQLLNIPGSISFIGLFEEPQSLKGERREVSKEWRIVTIS